MIIECKSCKSLMEWVKSKGATKPCYCSNCRENEPIINECVQCGLKFESDKVESFCSKQCRAKSNKSQPKVTRRMNPLDRDAKSALLAHMTYGQFMMKADEFKDKFRREVEKEWNTRHMKG